MSASMIGRTLGRYEITGEIGRGGMGVVYRATQTSLNRTVAVKMLPLAFTQTPEFLGRFRREAETLARLSHENVVHVYDVEELDGTPFIVMELVSGRDAGAHRDVALRSVARRASPGVQPAPVRRGP